MTVDTLTLAGFLLARIAEDEAVAQRIQHDYQHVLGIPHYFEPVARGGMVGITPKAALAECEAKRRIMTEYREFVEPDPDDGIALYADDTPEDRLWPEFSGGAFSELRKVVRLLAVVYADHPDFREEWRP